jgi:SAM-dependent methyltransferase
MASPLQESAEIFELGYPWVSKNLHVSCAEIAKVAQAFRALETAGASGKRIIEFGCGWGNLAVPLAKTGQDVTVVDIDVGFLDRIGRICAKENINITTIESEFLSACAKADGLFDAVVFQASFHHCLDFDQLLHQIKNTLLTPTGSVFFFSEPVFDGYAFPWGIRYDGESLWAVMVNKWLELGFDQSFFSSLMLSNGFFLTRIPEVPGYVGNGWRATQAANGVNFADWVLPNSYSKTFHEPDASGTEGRFCRAKSILPALPDVPGNAYRLTVRNYAPRALDFAVGSGRLGTSSRINPGEQREIQIISDGEDIPIRSDIFCSRKRIKDIFSPRKRIKGNGDTRELGIFLAHVSAHLPNSPSTGMS